MFTTAGLPEADYQRIRPEMWEANRKSVCAFSAMASVMFAAMTVLSFLVGSLRNMCVLYILCAAVCLWVLVLSYGPARGNTRLTALVMYSFVLLLLVFGILLGTLYTPDELAVSYIALLLTTPQIFTDRPRRMCTMIAASFVIFVVLCVMLKEKDIWGTDVINAAVFGILSMFCCAYLMKLKLERYVFESDTRILAETDQLTGVLNRNSYELQLRKGPELDAETYTAVYVDVNGLHDMNNTQGHTAGDEMLRYVAQAIQGIFGTENTYRIGGDEFVALGLDRTEAEVRERVRILREQVTKAGYHVAVGIGFRHREALDVTELIREAEQQMYEDKDAYYRETGISRERR